jgi:hypothetical protein
MHEMQLFRDHRLIKGGLNLMQELLAKGEENATVTLSILATIPILLLTLFYSLIFGKKKKSAPVVSEEAIKKDDPVVPDDAGANKEEVVEEETQEQAGEIEGEEAPAAVRRRTRRDT